MHAVLRIDEVEKDGPGRISEATESEGGKVATFPLPIYTPRGGDSGP